MKDTKAYWLSPKGDVHDVDLKHINFIRDNPKMFKMTKDEYLATYKKFKEPFGWEGKAREELIIRALKIGWVRIRDYMNKGWSVEVWELDRYAKDSIFDWAIKVKKLIEHFIEINERTSFYSHDTVNIHIVKLEKSGKPQTKWFIETSFDEIIQGKLYEKYVKTYESFNQSEK
jgi:hypothetical protein